MCLIIASPKGNRTATNVLRYAFEQNPHGWGVMYSNGNSIQVEKGMHCEPFLMAVERAHGLPHVIHLRYATHGAKNRANTHPFKVRDGLWMAHNGILKIATPNKERSDTWHYVQFLSELLAEYPDYYGTDEFLKTIGSDIGHGNKFAFLENSGAIKIVNEDSGFWHDGQWYSNTYSLPAKFEDIALRSQFGLTPFNDIEDELEIEFESEMIELTDEQLAVMSAEDVEEYYSAWEGFEREYAARLQDEDERYQELSESHYSFRRHNRESVYSRW